MRQPGAPVAGRDMGVLTTCHVTGWKPVLRRTVGAVTPALPAFLRRRCTGSFLFDHLSRALRQRCPLNKRVGARGNVPQRDDVRPSAGGYFQSEATLKLKLGALTFGLEQGRWSAPAAAVGEALHQLNRMFEARFETEGS